MLRTMIAITALALVGGSGCRQQCPHLTAPSTFYKAKADNLPGKTLDCDNDETCLSKAQEAAQSQVQHVARVQACRHSRRAARAEGRFPSDKPPPRRLADRAARHRDAEAQLLRAAMGVTEPPEDPPPPKPSTGETPAKPKPQPKPWVLLTRHAQAEHEISGSECIQQGRHTCGLTDVGSARARALATMLDQRVVPGCAAALEDFARTEQTALPVVGGDPSTLVKVGSADMTKPWTKDDLEQCKVQLVVGRSEHMKAWLEAVITQENPLRSSIPTLAGSHGVLLAFQLDGDGSPGETPVICRYGEEINGLSNLPECSAALANLPTPATATDATSAPATPPQNGG